MGCKGDLWHFLTLLHSKRKSHQSLYWVDLLQKGQDIVTNADASCPNLMLYADIRKVILNRLSEDKID